MNLGNVNLTKEVSMKKTRREFDSDFKRQAVSMVTIDGKSCRAV